MCLILVRNPEVQIEFDKIKHAVLNNRDGWGYVIPDRGKLEVRRFYDPKGTDPDDVYNVLDEYLDRRVFLHLRYATAGEKSAKNCHPFPALQQRKDGMQVWVMHNGTVSNYKTGNDQMSDTYHFTDKVISPLLRRVVKYTGKKGLLDDPFVGQVIEKFANNWSKWVLIDSYGNHQIVGSGEQKDGYWVSNDYSFRPSYREPAKSTSVKSYYYPGYAGTPQPSVLDTDYYDVTKEDKDESPFSQGSCAVPTQPSTSTAVAVVDPKTAVKDKWPEAEPLEMAEKTSFLELLGLKSLDELYTMTEEDIYDMVVEYPEIMTVLIRDLLWERANG